jgi:hypothetical protein
LPSEAESFRVMSTYEAVCQTAAVASDLADRVSGQFTSDLDDFVARVDEYLDSNREGWSDYELQRMVVRLPVLLYRLSEGISRSALESEIAKALLDRMYAEKLLLADGRTAAERKAHAELQLQAEASVVNITKIVYQKLKAKTDHAVALYEGIKKIMVARDTEHHVFGMEQKKRA